MPVADPSIPQWLMTLAMAILSWAALRLVRKIDAFDVKVDNVVIRVVSIEAKLDNGLSHGVEEMKDGFEKLSDRLTEHIEGEERRILEAQRSFQRGGSLRQTRRADPER